MVSMTNQTIAYWPQASYSPQGQEAGRTQGSPQPTWEAYYQYAQQLYAAGHQQQAEAYYRQAQQLFRQAESRQRRERPATSQAYSYSPSPSPSYSPSPSPSYSPPPSNYTAIGVPAIRPVSALVPEDIDDVTIPTKRPKRPLKKRIKIWAVTSLMICLLVSAGGYLGLFYFYKNQLSQGPTQRAIKSSLLGCVQDLTLNPMVDVLKPAFDKTIRLSAAAQPLLHELNLGGTPLEDVRSKEPETEKPGEAEPPAAAEAEPAQVSETSEVNTARETISPMEQEATSAGTPPASADADEPAAPTDAPIEAPVADDKSAIASDIEDGDVEPRTKGTSSSRARSRRSKRNRSDRSGHSAQNDGNSSYVDKAQPTAPSGNGGWPVESSAASSESTPPQAPPRPSRKNSKIAELDDLLAPKPESSSRPENSSADKSASPPPVKASLSRVEVQRGLVRVAPAVKRCGQGRGGTISINVKIGPNGRVSSAVTAGVYAGTPIGACAERAVRGAVFPASQQSITVKYPFTL
jgi:hypothetical protein